MIIPALLAASLCGGAAPTTWPGFRGDGSSVATTAALPHKWSPTENVAWRTTLPGYGQSSPVVWGGRAFVTAVEGKEKETLIVVAVDVRTGKVAWKKELSASQKGKNNPVMSRAAPTPVVDGERVYAFFESGDVVALNHAGEVQWHRSLSKDHGELKNNHGVGSSPAQTDRAVVVLIDHQGPSYLVALDKATGKDRWKADRKGRASWTSPVVATIGDRATVIVSSGGAVDAYDATSGKLLATHGGLVGNTIPSPTVSGELVLVGAGEDRRNPDAVASARSNCCLRLTLKDGKAAFERAWEGDRAVSQHASPVAYRGQAYFVTRAGGVVCVDLRTGAERYSQRLAAACWATPIAAGDHVFFFGKDGVTTVLKAGPKYERVAVNRLWSAEDFTRRLEDAKKKAADTLPAPKEGKGPKLPKAARESMMYSAVGDVVYGVAAAEGAWLIRTGTELIGVRAADRNPLVAPVPK